MHQNDSQALNFWTSESSSGDVRFDPENVTLKGNYRDELSAYRAKQIWNEALESHFLLDFGQDFALTVTSHSEEGRFELSCDFKSACARYAFWRLTNHQAPEVQYVIETAHIPNCELRHEEFLTAPDLRSTEEDSSYLPTNTRRRKPTLTGEILARIRKLVGSST